MRNFMRRKARLDNKGYIQNVFDEDLFLYL
jgi:hypothetical protein